MIALIEKVFYYPFLGTDFYHIAYSFFLYGFACWVMECIFEAIRTKRFTNRGFNQGPICTIYGVAFLGMYFPMKPFVGHWVAMFIVGAIVATILEYIVGVILERLVHERFWDYSDMPFNVNGRVCLFISVAWGFLVLIVLGFLQPRVEMLISLIPKRIGFYVLNALIWTYFIDLAFSIALHSKYGDQVRQRVDTQKKKIRVRFHMDDEE